MSGVFFYRDDSLPFFELKSCSIDELSYKKHAHEEYSLGIIEKGRTKLWYEGKNVELDQEKFVVIPANKLHVCHPYDEGNWQYNMLYVDAKWLERLPYDISKEVPVVRDVLPADRKNIAVMIRKFTSNISPLAKEAAMMTGFMKLFSGSEQLLNEECKLKQETAKIELAEEYIRAHFLDKITLDDLEAAAGLNKYYIVRLFKRHFNISPHAYQTLLRINYAKKELKKQRSLAEVALTLGFFDQSHFTKAFKGYVGATPEGYRKSLTKNQFFTIQSK